MKNIRLKKFYDKVYKKGEGKHYTKLLLGPKTLPDEESEVLKSAVWKGKKVSAGTTAFSAILFTAESTTVTASDDDGVPPLYTPNTSSVFTVNAAAASKLQMIVPGETVVTSGDEFMPPNILIGTIVRVISEPRDPFKQAEVRLTVNPDHITSVFVISED